MSGLFSQRAFNNSFYSFLTFHIKTVVFCGPFKSPSYINFKLSQSANNHSSYWHTAVSIVQLKCFVFVAFEPQCSGVVVRVEAEEGVGVSRP